MRNFSQNDNNVSSVGSRQLISRTGKLELRFFRAASRDDNVPDFFFQLDSSSVTTGAFFFEVENMTFASTLAAGDS